MAVLGAPLNIPENICFLAAAGYNDLMIKILLPKPFSACLVRPRLGLARLILVGVLSGCAVPISFSRYEEPLSEPLISPQFISPQSNQGSSDLDLPKVVPLDLQVERILDDGTRTVFGKEDREYQQQWIALTKFFQNHSISVTDKKSDDAYLLHVTVKSSQGKCLLIAWEASCGGAALSSIMSLGLLPMKLPIRISVLWELRDRDNQLYRHEIEDGYDAWYSVLFLPALPVELVRQIANKTVARIHARQWQALKLKTES
jgi:hypothetical protein